MQPLTVSDRLSKDRDCTYHITESCVSSIPKVQLFANVFGVDATRVNISPSRNHLDPRELASL